MNLETLPIDMLPQLDSVPAAFGALEAPMQISGGTVFDIIVAAILATV
jgi:hypothetical protein